MRLPRLLLSLFCMSLALAGAAQAQELSPGTGPTHAIAMHGEPKHGPGFAHFDYVNPDAPKGGRLVLAEVATFDSLNPFIVLGRPMWHLRFPRRTTENLMLRSDDEPFTLYCLLCESVEMPDDRSWIAFTLRDDIRFSDGTPMTVEDVLFSFEVLKEHGRPHYRARHGKVARIDRLDERTVRFVFKDEIDDRELPLLLAMMAVFSKADYAERDFEKTTLEPPLGSGPYIVDKVDPGRSLTFKRNPDYWGADLAVTRGFSNFDEIRYDYYRDASTAFEAFKAGDADIRIEPDSNALRWARGYNFPAFREGRVKRAEFAHGRAVWLLGFAFNTRRAIFADRRVRKALTIAFDYAWLNDNYFFGAYKRSRSFFQNSDLGATGAADAAERALLAPFMDEVDPEILEHGLQLTRPGDYYARTRARLTEAMDLFQEAGYAIRDGAMTDPDTGAPFSFEIMIEHPDHQRVALNYADELKKIGVTVRVRLVDSAQFLTRSRTRDFDMMPFEWRGSLSPGNEQRFRWSAQAAETDGTFNFSGVKSPAIDTLIDRMVSARAREDLVTAARAFDRVLLSGYYVLPLYHAPKDRVAWWDHLQGPETLSLTGYNLDTWWAVAPPP